MPRYSPLKGWRARTTNESGKRGIVFNHREAFTDLPVEIACGQCIGCRVDRSKAWAIRCVLEASQHQQNCFITLTYDDEHLPTDGSLNVEHWQKFMKRLRKAYGGKRIRFYHCGEYGDENSRPHYHACLFGHQFEDQVLYSERNGVRLYYSERLEKIWGKGFCTVGDVTFESAAYVARYVMKKVTGDRAADHYLSLNPITGVISEIAPEYTTMSRRPGLAADWYEKFKSDVFPDDFIVINGKQMKVPQFFDAIHEREDLEGHLAIKGRRRAAANGRAADQTPDRLRVREAVKRKKLAQLKREI